MSLEAITLVRTLPRRGIHLAPRDRFVLYALADFANEDHEAWPSHRTIAEWTGFDKRTIVRALESLQEAGLIQRQRRARDDGSMTSNQYRLRVTPQCQRDTPQCHTVTTPPPESHQGSDTESLGVVSESHTMNHQIEPPMNPQGTKSKNGALAKLDGTPTPAELLQAWNDNRGPLPEAKKLNGPRAGAMNRLRKEHGKDVMPLFIAAVRCVSRDEFYIENNYGIDTLLKPGRVQQRAEQYANSNGFTKGDRKLATTADIIARAIGGIDA